MVRALALALALSAIDAFVPATTQSSRVAPMKMSDGPAASSKPEWDELDAAVKQADELDKALQQKSEPTDLKYSPATTVPPPSPAMTAPPPKPPPPVPPTPKVDTILIQGSSLRTWSYRSPLVNHVQVVLSTEGRPLDADLELWHGPDNTPCKMRVYVENGQLRPFSAVIATPRGPNTVAIRNIGQLEFPIAADVYANDVEMASEECVNSATTIQGGALRTYPFDPLVDSVEVLLRTDGRPLNARIELLQGPNNNKQVVELYTEDGLDRPFFAILETPGSGNVVRIVNTAPVEFPMTAAVFPRSVEEGAAVDARSEVVIGGDIGW
jgi:hypothetical protein